MSVALTPELEEFVRDEVASGRYNSESDLIQDGLKLLRQRELERQALEREIQKGIDQLERGEYIRFSNEQEAKEYFDSLPERAMKKRRTKSSESK